MQQHFNVIFGWTFLGLVSTVVITILVFVVVFTSWRKEQTGICKWILVMASTEYMKYSISTIKDEKCVKKYNSVEVPKNGNNFVEGMFKQETTDKFDGENLNGSSVQDKENQTRYYEDDEVKIQMVKHSYSSHEAGIVMCVQKLKELSLTSLTGSRLKHAHKSRQIAQCADLLPKLVRDICVNGATIRDEMNDHDDKIKKEFIKQTVMDGRIQFGTESSCANDNSDIKISKQSIQLEAQNGIQEDLFSSKDVFTDMKIQGNHSKEAYSSLGSIHREMSFNSTNTSRIIMKKLGEQESLKVCQIIKFRRIVIKGLNVSHNLLSGHEIPAGKHVFVEVLVKQISLFSPSEIVLGLAPSGYPCFALPGFFNHSIGFCLSTQTLMVNAVAQDLDALSNKIRHKLRLQMAVHRNVSQDCDKESFCVQFFINDSPARDMSKYESCSYPLHVCIGVSGWAMLKISISQEKESKMCPILSGKSMSDDIDLFSYGNATSVS